ncbi:hypothetical protein HDU92_006610 [Lobulomyces angularis]|nr:hypothetical protein HDU92_006610 [Lobulomyces angularis]
MYAYIMQPNTIPKEYYSWIVKMGQVPKETLQLNRDNVRSLETSHFKTDAKLKLTTAVNLIKKFSNQNVKSEAAIQTTKEIFNTKNYFPVIPCSVLHPSEESCLNHNKSLFINMLKNMLPIYISLNIIPMIVFRGRSFVNNPVKNLYRSLLSASRSSTFLATFVIVNMGAICTQRKIILWKNRPKFFNFLPVTDNKLHYYICGILCSSTIFLENTKRRPELAMYVLPKGLTSLYQVLLNRGYKLHIKNFDVYLFGIGMGVLMSFYQCEPDVIGVLLYKVMNKVIGKN